MGREDTYMEGGNEHTVGERGDYRTGGGDEQGAASCWGEELPPGPKIKGQIVPQIC